jgi:hypothetical protein
MREGARAEQGPGILPCQRVIARDQTMDGELGEAIVNRRAKTVGIDLAVPFLAAGQTHPG